MKPKAYDEKTIAEIREKRKNGAKVMQLAIEYYVHYKTIENYCKGIRVRKQVELTPMKAKAEK